MTTLWPWLVIAGLGAFHGANPAMGWLFAVALGLHRHSRAVVGLSLLPIALGHALSVGAIVLAFVLLGVMVDTRLIIRAAGVLLIGWALYHALFGHRRRVRFGMQIGMAGLFAWSFLMASAHGAGLMLIPAIAPLCLADAAGRGFDPGGSILVAVLALGLHTAAMLAVTAAAALMVYEWVGVAVLRRGWINIDALWTAALAVCGLVLIFR